MLATLFESRGRSPRRRIALSASAVVHSLLLIVVVMARPRGGSATDANEPELPHIVWVAPEQEHRMHREQRQPSAGSLTYATLPPIVPRIVVDPEIVGPDVRIAMPREPVVTRFGSALSASADTAARVADAVLTEMAVDHPVEMLPGQRPPQYPTALERAGIAGAVAVQFVVDTAGRVERGSVRVLHATHSDFAVAVEGRLATLRFVPARARGRLVRQLVEQRFQFEVVRR